MEFLTLAPGSDRIPVELLQILTQYAICQLPAGKDSSLITFIQHSFESPSYSSHRRKRSKRNAVGREEVKLSLLDFSGGPVVKNLPSNAGDMGLIPGPGRSHMPWDS